MVLPLLRLLLQPHLPEVPVLVVLRLLRLLQLHRRPVETRLLQPVR